MDLKRRLAILAVPPILAVGGASLAAVHAATPTPTPSSSSKQTAEPAENENETTGSAEANDPAEAPGTPGAAEVGHADNPNDPNADHQFEGQE